MLAGHALGHGKMSKRSEVTHIETREGRRGGRTWWLTLACGHFKSVRVPRVLPFQVAFRKLTFAPKYVKCWGCK